MVAKKSIIKKSFTVYLILLTIIVIFFISFFGFINKIILVAALFLPLIIVIHKAKYKRFLIEWVLYWLLLAVVLIAYFKKLREMDISPEIDSNKIVGFSQYFGYPVNFDSVFFFSFLCSPVVIIIFILIKNKILNKIKNEKIN